MWYYNIIICTHAYNLHISTLVLRFDVHTCKSEHSLIKPTLEAHKNMSISEPVFGLVRIGSRLIRPTCIKLK